MSSPILKKPRLVRGFFFTPHPTTNPHPTTYQNPENDQEKHKTLLKHQAPHNRSPSHSSQPGNEPQKQDCNAKPGQKLTDPPKPMAACTPPPTPADPHAKTLQCRPDASSHSTVNCAPDSVNYADNPAPIPNTPPPSDVHTPQASKPPTCDAFGQVSDAHPRPYANRTNTREIVNCAGPKNELIEISPWLTPQY